MASKVGSGSIEAVIPDHVEHNLADFLRQNFIGCPMTEHTIDHIQEVVDKMMVEYANLGTFGPHSERVRCRIFPDYSQGFIQGVFEMKF